MKNDSFTSPVEVVKRRVEINSLGLGETLDHPGEGRDRGEVWPDGNRSLPDAQAAVRHQDRRIGPLLNAQPLADRAPTERTVEREMMRRQLVKAATATIAHSMLTVAIDRPTRLAGLVADACDVHNPFAQIEGRFDRVRKP